MKTIYLIMWLINACLAAFVFPMYEPLWILYVANIVIPFSLLLIRTVLIFNQVKEIKEADRNLWI